MCMTTQHSRAANHDALLKMLVSYAASSLAPDAVQQSRTTLKTHILLILVLLIINLQHRRPI